jgi:UvrD/REP helicase N-terminal domain
MLVCEVLQLGYIKNHRRYGEDSYEFYTPIEGTDLILTWRMFADLHYNHSGSKGSESNSGFFLQYTLSFDALRRKNAPIKLGYNIHTDWGFVQRMLLKEGRLTLQNQSPCFSSPSRGISYLFATIGTLLNEIDLMEGKFPNASKPEYHENLKALDSSHKSIKFHVWDKRLPDGSMLYKVMLPRFKGHLKSIKADEMQQLSLKQAIPQWIFNAFRSMESDIKQGKELNQSFISDETFNEAVSVLDDSGVEINPEMRVKIDPQVTQQKRAILEYNWLKSVVSGAFMVFSLDKVEYSPFLEKTSRSVQIYFDRAESDTLSKSLKRVWTQMKTVTQDQIEITSNLRNTLFFGRSGTGKTMCAIGALVSRQLTVDAIAKKLQQTKAPQSSETSKPIHSGLRSIFITASPLLAKEVKAQYQTTLKKAETLNAKEGLQILTEDAIFESLHSVYVRSKELPKTFYDEDISYPLFLSHQEFVSILYNTMIETSVDFQHLGARVNINTISDDKVIERRIADIMKSFGQQNDKMSKVSKFIPKRKHRSSAAQSKRQIDFRVFYEEFYKKNIARNSKLCKISSNVAWSEIRTKIKGSSFAYFEKSNGAGYNAFDETLRTAVLENYKKLQPDERLNKMVFEIFESYEAWKQANNYFDIEDFVGLFYRRIKKWPYKDFNFDLVLIDEVQDLSFNSIQVLTTLCLNNFMICGDNAQNIEKGINFKFKDLRNFLSNAISNRSEKVVDYGDYYNQSVNLPELSYYHLGLNFRSSSEILELANLVVCLLETYFFNEIDTFPKERGFFRSPKPLILELGTSQDFLVSFLENYLKMETEIDDEANNTLNQSESMVDDSAAILKKKIKIGNDFCVIVRDEQAKNSVPAALRNCIVLTLQESKGLEFENVLLYNHFIGNDAEKAWRYMFSRTTVQGSQATQKEMDEYLKETDLFRKSKLELQKFTREGSSEQFIFSTNAVLDQISTQAQLEGLSADLKFLYVAITRAKKNMIIYDHFEGKPVSHIRLNFDDLCDKLKVADVVNEKNHESFYGRYIADPDWRAAQQNLAREKGYCFLKLGEYASAERFFKVSNDSRLIQYCRASEKAKMAGDLLSIEFDDELKKKYTNLEQLQIEMKKVFHEAAEMFAELGKHNEAGKCYFSCEQYQLAAENFLKMDNKLYLAHSLFMVGKQEEAVPLYYELEQDDMVQACLVAISDGGKDIKKFGSMLSGMSDETKQVAKFDDSTFMNFLRSVFEELQRENEEKEDFGFDQADGAIKDSGSALPEGKDDEMMAEKSGTDSIVDLAEQTLQSDDEFMELKSVISDIRSSGGSFEVLPSLKGLKSFVEVAEQKVWSEKVLSRLEIHVARITKLLELYPGHQTLFSNTQPSSAKKVMLDLALVLGYEDLGTQLYKESDEPLPGFIDKLILSKLCNLDLNLSESRVFDPFKPEASKFPSIVEKPNWRDLVTLNVFDTLALYKFDKDLVYIKSVDDSIKRLFFDICVMGLAEYFYPMAYSPEIKEQLELFISANEIRRLRKLESFDESSISIVDLSPIKNLHAEKSLKELLTGIQTEIQNHSLSTLLATGFHVNKSGLASAVEMVTELANRVITYNKTGAVEWKELSEALQSYPIWTLIKFIRILSKKSFAIRGDRDKTLAIILKSFSARDLGCAKFAGNSFESFLAVESDSWVFGLCQSTPGMKNRIKLEKEYPFFHLNKDNDLIIVEKGFFFELAFNLLVSELLLRFHKDDPVLIMKVEIESNLTIKEKSGLKFSRLFEKKIEETIIIPEDTGFSPAVIEDYYWSKTKYTISSKSANPVLVYRTYALLTRLEKSSKIVPALIKELLVSNKEYKLFFLLKEIDELFEGGQVGLAYFKLEDLHNFVKASKTELSKNARFYLDLKELLILLVAYGSVPPKSEEASRFFNRQEFFAVSDYFRSDLQSCKWIVQGAEDTLYFNEAQLDFDHLDGLSMNIGEKILSILQELPLAIMSATGSNLEQFVAELVQRSGIISSPGSIYCLILVPVKSLKVQRISSTSRAELIKLAADRVVEFDQLKTAIEKSEAFVVERNRKLEIMKKREFKTPGVAIEKRQEVILDLKGKVVVPYQCNALVREITKNAQIRNYIVSFILKTTVSSPIEYIFLADIVSRLRQSIRQKEGYPSTVLHIEGTAEHQSKRLEQFLQEKKRYASTRAVKGAQYQADIKAKLKMISMIGGQVYKQIIEKNKSKSK